jgi:hypothetical protein
MPAIGVRQNQVSAGDGVVRPLPLSRKLRLAAEILLTYGHVRWTVRRQELPRVVETLRSESGWRWPSRPLPDGARDGVRLGQAVVRTLEPLPADSRCLMRSLVLLRVLARRGVDCSLVIAVKPGGQLALGAHAWVELDARPLLAPAGADYGRLLTL